MEHELAGVVLCGGGARRMGRDRALLPFGDEPMVTRVARVLEEFCTEVVLVGRSDQQLPGGYRIVHDTVEGEGPLAGLIHALEATRTPALFLASCDTPLLRRGFVRRVIDLGSGYAAAVPLAPDGRIVPIGAVYTHRLLDLARDLFLHGERRLAELTRQVDTRYLRPEEFADVDPDLESLLSVNTPEVYAEALRRSGLAAPRT